MRKFVVALLGLAAAVAIAAGVAYAHHAIYRTQVTVHYVARSGNKLFHGRVVSRHDKCKPGRTVLVRMVSAGRDSTVGTSQSRKDGRWEVAAHGGVKPGKYYAKVKRKVLIHSRHHWHVCRHTKSRKITAK
jgi:hypothetical protein